MVIKNMGFAKIINESRGELLMLNSDFNKINVLNPNRPLVTQLKPRLNGQDVRTYYINDIFQNDRSVFAICGNCEAVFTFTSGVAQRTALGFNFNNPIMINDHEFIYRKTVHDQELTIGKHDLMSRKNSSEEIDSDDPFSGGLATDGKLIYNG